MVKYKFIVCLAEKHTKKKLSDFYEVEAPNEYRALDEFEKILGRKLDGYSEYMDYVKV